MDKHDHRAMTYLFAGLLAFVVGIWSNTYSINHPDLSFLCSSKDEVCLDVGCDPQTATALMQRMSSSGNPLSVEDVPCPAPAPPKPQDANPTPDDDEEGKKPKTLKPKKEKPAVPHLIEPSNVSNGFVFFLDDVLL